MSTFGSRRGPDAKGEDVRAVTTIGIIMRAIPGATAEGKPDGKRKPAGDEAPQRALSARLLFGK